MGFAGEALSLLTTFFLAGWFAGWIVIPSPLGRWERLFLSLSLAVPATVLAAGPGVATHSLATWNLLVGLLVLAAVAAWRMRHTLASVPQRMRSGELSVPRRPRRVPTLLVAFALLATWLTVLVPEGIEHTGTGHPNGTIVYYHWGIVGRVVEDGGLPATLPEWGRQREFPYEYAFSVIHGASTASLADDYGFVLEERYRIALVVTAFFALFALWRRWLPPWWSWLAAILTLNVSRVETRFLVYKPEAFAFILVIWSAWLLDEALERRSPRWGALAGLVLASSFMAHPVGSLLVAPLWGGILIGRIAPVLWRRWRHETPIGGAIPWRSLVVAVAVFAVLFGSLRTVIGSTGQDLAQSPVKGIDETRVVYNLSYVSADPFAEPRVPECNHPFGVYSTVRPFLSANASWFFFDLHAPSSVLLILGGLVVIGGAFLLQTPPRLARWPAPLKRAAITWPCYALGVYLLAVLICIVYSTWVPERVGPMRLMPYWALIFPIFIAAVAWGGSRLISKREWAWRVGGSDAGWSSWFGGGVALLPALVFSAGAIWTFTTITATQDRGVPPFYIAEPRAGGLSQDSLAAYRWISQNLPSDARILANGYTEGAVGMLSRRMGILDGRTPFAQPDPWRREAIDLLMGARRFFLDPEGTRVPGGADYLLVASQDTNLGGSYFPTAFDALEADRSLELVRSFGGVRLYRIDTSKRKEADHLSSIPGIPPESVHILATSSWGNSLTRERNGRSVRQPSC